MPATMEIRENGRVVYFVFSSPFTTQEMIDTMQKDGEYRNSVPFKVHALLRVELTQMPPMALRGRESPSITHPNSGLFAIVGANSIVRTFAETVIRMTRNKQMRFFDTEEEAWAVVREMIAQEP
jgi:hypothetical protein